jgi:beta-lactamase superfamily II metal-dependent hydrolase
MKSMLFSLLICATTFASGTDGKLDIYWVDVEGGGATLLVTPTGESLLIDTGNPGGRDAGRIAHVAKDVAHLSRIDHVVITHFHIDHFGGAAELDKLIPLGTIYTHGHPPAEGKPLPSEFESLKSGQRTALKPGDKLPIKGLGVTCLVAAQQVIAAGPQHKPAEPGVCDVKPQADDRSDNANSIALLVNFHGFKFFDGGDLTWNTEQKLVCPVNLVGNIDVYQVNHHGLDVSNNPALIRSLAPTVAVMNNAERKGTGPMTVDTLRHTPSIQAIYQVHESLWPSPQANTQPEMIANHGTAGEKGLACKANHIELHVAPDGSSYSLAIPATQHTRTFETRK